MKAVGHCHPGKMRLDRPDEGGLCCTVAIGAGILWSAEAAQG